MPRRVAAAVLLASYAVLLTGCGSTPEKLGEAGIDAMTIPTPSPRAGDFTDRVDNPYFPLDPGARWTYRIYSANTITVERVRVLDRPVVVAGVRTLGVRVTTGPRDDRRFLAKRWYAQDTAGNVWWFGQRVAPGGPPDDVLARRSWRAGIDGAEAGLMMPGDPRLGDGFANGYRPDLFERHATVRTLSEVVAVPHRQFQDTLETQDESTLLPTVVVTSFYAPGVGLVSRQTVLGGTVQVALVRYRAPAAG